MRIGLDFDGVISDCGQLKSDSALKLYGISIPPRLFKKEIVVGEGHLRLEQYRHLQKEIYHGRELGLLMEPVPGVHLFLSKLRDRGHEIVVVTSREPEACEIALEWALSQGLDLELIGVGYGNSKAEAAQARNLDVYADDDLDKLVPPTGIVPHLFLFSWGYNEHINEQGIAKRVASWEDLYRIIVTLEASH